MATNKELINWIKIHLDKGYSPEYIRRYLLDHGYTIDDIDKAINAARGKEEVKKRRVYGFYFSLIAGLLILLDSISSIFGYMLPLRDYLGVLAGIFRMGLIEMVKQQLGFFTLMLGMAVGILFMINSLLLVDESRARSGGIFSLMLSITSFFTVNGFYLGFVSGVVSGILGVLRR